MNVMGLIMAGGAGTRMANSGGTVPKPLVPVRGRAMLEHNVRAMLASGVNDIVISVRADGQEIADFSLSQCRPLVAAEGGTLEVLIEDKPLGNIGCLGSLRDKADTVVVTYADNLTALNPQDLLWQHLQNKSDLTLAAHWHPFQMPFGELKTDGTQITAYAEKPVTKWLVCSAVCVAGPNAVAVLPDDKPTGLSQFAQMLIAKDLRVDAFEHEVPWIDVNDTLSIAKAEQLIEDNPQAFSWFVSDDMDVAKAA